MATKVALANQDGRPKMPGIVEKVVDQWNEFTRFLSDVRAEMRKVVTPTRKEVEATTSVVIIAVFLFGVYFFLVDGIFANLINQLLKKTGGLQQ
jgi:preprotein translocase subunit SecE